MASEAVHSLNAIGPNPPKPNRGSWREAGSAKALTDSWAKTASVRIFARLALPNAHAEPSSHADLAAEPTAHAERGLPTGPTAHAERGLPTAGQS